MSSIYIFHVANQWHTKANYYQGLYYTNKVIYVLVTFKLNKLFSQYYTSSNDSRLYHDVFFHWAFSLPFIFTYRQNVLLLL